MRRLADGYRAAFRPGRQKVRRWRKATQPPTTLGCRSAEDYWISDSGGATRWTRSGFTDATPGIDRSVVVTRDAVPEGMDPVMQPIASRTRSTCMPPASSERATELIDRRCASSTITVTCVIAPL